MTTLDETLKRDEELLKEVLKNNVMDIWLSGSEDDIEAQTAGIVVGTGHSPLPFSQAVRKRLIAAYHLGYKRGSETAY